MNDLTYYVGMDIHKKNVYYCVKLADGKIVSESKVISRREDLANWAQSLPKPWIGAMEATLFTGFVYDTILPFCEELKVADPVLLKAITYGKKKNDIIDARTIADMLRADLVPECYMAPKNYRDLRDVLRFRNYLVRICTSLKNKTAGLLMQSGVQYNKSKLHGKYYFRNLLGNLQDIPESVKVMARYSHSAYRLFKQIQTVLLKEISNNPLLKNRLSLLRSIPSVGEITSLTWALEVVDPHRFSNINKAVSYAGLCSAQRESGGKSKRGPLSKRRNKHLQWVLIEIAKMAPRHNRQLAAVYDKELAKGNKNSATIAVARKLVAYLMAVDKSGIPFQYRS